MTLQTSRAICGTNRDRTALMYSTFRAEKQKQCPKKSGDAGEGIGNYVSPNRVLRRNRVRALPEPERDEKDSTVSSNRTLIRNRFRALPEPERDERNSTVSPTRAPRRNRVRTLPEPERDERNSTVSPSRALRRNRVRTLPEAGKRRKKFKRFAKPSAETKSGSGTTGAGKGRKESKESLRTQLTILPSPLASASVPLSLPPGRIDPLPTAAREGRAGDRQDLLATSSV